MLADVLRRQAPDVLLTDHNRVLTGSAGQTHCAQVSNHRRDVLLIHVECKDPRNCSRNRSGVSAGRPANARKCRNGRSAGRRIAAPTASPAASIAIVPPPAIGSTSGSKRASHLDSITSCAAIVSRSGARPPATRAPRRCRAPSPMSMPTTVRLASGNPARRANKHHVGRLCVDFARDSARRECVLNSVLHDAA